MEEDLGTRMEKLRGPGMEKDLETRLGKSMGKSTPPPPRLGLI